MPFLKSVRLNGVGESYPFEIPSIRSLLHSSLELHPKVTFLVGENGSGKSTLLEGMADKWGFASQSGNRSQSLGLRNYETALAHELVISKAIGIRPMDGFFLRAESLYNFATQLEELEQQPFCASGYFAYGGKSLHEQSHGESFFSIFMNRFDGHGLFMLDEPEAALSTKRQMSFLVRLHDLCEDSSQFIIATHSPILLAYPEAIIYECSEDGIRQIDYKETETYRLTKRFIDEPEQMIRRLLESD